MDDWATTKAREWLAQHSERFTYYGHESATGAPIFASLAALLREVAALARAGVVILTWDKEQPVVSRVVSLAEVRRVVEKTASDVRLACISTSESDAVGALRGALLSRLDKL